MHPRWLARFQPSTVSHEFLEVSLFRSFKLLQVMKLFGVENAGQVCQFMAKLVTKRTHLDRFSISIEFWETHQKWKKISSGAIPNS